MHPHHALFKRWLVAAASLALLVLAFWLYSRPDIALLLAEQLWACF